MMNPRKNENPFNWINRRDLAVNFIEEQTLNVDWKEEPVLSFIRDIMLVYVRTMKNEKKGAEEKLKKLEETWRILDKGELKKENISVEVLNHILKTTMYHVYKSKGDKAKMVKIIEDIVDPEEFKDTVHLSTIDGCKAIAWSFFYEAKCDKAIAFAKSAIRKNSQCPLWYYMLTKNLRRQRRINFYPYCPSTEEKESIKKCCELSPRIFYKLLHAQVLLDAKKRQKSLDIYLEIYQSNPISVDTHLRLALAFIKNRRNEEITSCLDNARSCLNYAKELEPRNTMFFYCKGIYLKEVEENYEEAMRYFEESADPYNFSADICYAKCLFKLNRTSDCIKHLNGMLQKYNNDLSYKQSLLLHIAMLFYKENNFLEASENFLQAIQINSRSRRLQRFKNELDDNKYYNIFEFIKTRLYYPS